VAVRSRRDSNARHPL